MMRSTAVSRQRPACSRMDASIPVRNFWPKPGGRICRSKVADLRWLGHLSARLIARCTGDVSRPLRSRPYESLEASHLRNLISTHIETRFFWRDLLAEPIITRYDAIVAEPAVPSGAAAEPGWWQKAHAAAKA